MSRLAILFAGQKHLLFTEEKKKNSNHGEHGVREEKHVFALRRLPGRIYPLIQTGRPGASPAGC
jgi:hypothetical protein